MQIHELPTISGSPSGGYFATDNGTQTTKIDYTALAQAIIEQYNASTLAGSAQSVKAALDGLDGNKLDLKAGTAITSGTDVNTLQTPGTYFCSSASIAASLSNIPTQATSAGWRLDVARNGYNTDNYLTQTITGVSGGVTFEYVRGMSAKGTWGGWLKAPTRSEVDALTTNMGNFTCTREVISEASTHTYTLTHSHMYLVTVARGSNADDSTAGLYVVTAYNGAGLCKTISASSLATVSINKTTLTITTTAASVLISIMQIA